MRCGKYDEMHFISGGGRYKIVINHKDQPCIQFDCPHVMKENDKFTIFWRGHTDQKLLSEAANRLRNQTDKHLRTLYFFEDEMLYPPSHSIENLPTNRETQIIENYGDPIFLRYEFYTESNKDNVIQNCRVAFWASLSSFEEIKSREKTDKEIGVFITRKDFISSSCLKELDQFIKCTISPPQTHLEVYDCLSEAGGNL